MKLELDHVTKRFGEALVIDDVTESIRDRSSLVLIGPSGGGKSTLLRLIGGLLLPSAGEIKLNECSVPGDEVGLNRYRSRLGIVFQNFNLFPHLTAEENVVLPLTAVHEKSEAEARELAHQLLDRFQLSRHAAKKPYELSGGQRQRVAIARALSHRPQVMLFDEPTSALDPEMTGEVLDLIGELRSDGVHLILVTHEMGFARHVADEVWFLSDGKIIERGTPDLLFTQPAMPQTERFLKRVLKY